MRPEDRADVARALGLALSSALDRSVIRAALGDDGNAQAGPPSPCERRSGRLLRRPFSCSSDPDSAAPCRPWSWARRCHGRLDALFLAVVTAGFGLRALVSPAVRRGTATRRVNRA